MEVRTGFERLAEDHEAVVGGEQEQRDGDADVGLAAMRADAERDAHQGEADAGEGERQLTVQLHVDRREIDPLGRPQTPFRAQLREGHLVQFEPLSGNPLRRQRVRDLLRVERLQVVAGEDEPLHLAEHEHRRIGVAEDELRGRGPDLQARHPVGHAALHEVGRPADEHVPQLAAADLVGEEGQVRTQSHVASLGDELRLGVAEHGIPERLERDARGRGDLHVHHGTDPAEQHRQQHHGQHQRDQADPARAHRRELLVGAESPEHQQGRREQPDGHREGQHERDEQADRLRRERSCSAPRAMASAT